VLTGAMQPAKFRFTDAVVNIASAFAAVQLLPAGVYIAMNGRIFDPETSRKNRDLKRFEHQDLYEK
jgi:L-asparaginase